MIRSTGDVDWDLPVGPGSVGLASPRFQLRRRAGRRGAVSFFFFFFFPLFLGERLNQNPIPFQGLFSGVPSAVVRFLCQSRPFGGAS